MVSHNREIFLSTQIEFCVASQRSSSIGIQNFVTAALHWLCCQYLNQRGSQFQNSDGSSLRGRSRSWSRRSGRTWFNREIRLSTQIDFIEWLYKDAFSIANQNSVTTTCTTMRRIEMTNVRLESSQSKKL